VFWGLQAGGLCGWVLGAAALPRTLPARPGRLPAAGAMDALPKAWGCKVPPALVAMGASTWWVPEPRPAEAERGAWSPVPGCCRLPRCHLPRRLPYSKLVAMSAAAAGFISALEASESSRQRSGSAACSALPAAVVLPSRGGRAACRSRLAPPVPCSRRLLGAAQPGQKMPLRKQRDVSRAGWGPTCGTSRCRGDRRDAVREGLRWGGGGGPRPWDLLLMSGALVLSVHSFAPSSLSQGAAPPSAGSFAGLVSCPASLGRPLGFALAACLRCLPRSCSSRFTESQHGRV